MEPPINQRLLLCIVYWSNSTPRSLTMAQTSVINSTPLYGSNYRDFAVVRFEFLLAHFKLSLTFILCLFKGTKETNLWLLQTKRAFHRS